MGGKMRRLLVGISGATGIPIAAALLRQLKNIPDVETHLIYTRGAGMTLKTESSLTEAELCALADVVYDNQNIGAGPASGSWESMGMVIVPCSMKTVAGIHCGYSDNLLLRAADVTLKERRKLVLVARECPLSTIHLRNMYELSQMGAVILPPMMAYYNHPRSVEDCTSHIVGKILQQFGISAENFKRWEGMGHEGIYF